ncbi:hypothetical protein [Thiolapillus sp.]|uniref:hypothetical protein n=3 Tax=Thiolapillus sp. TaxID=2017437 RepID=UPI0025ED82B0|nr:hypothetical protein [Thiolapillus sp.]
MHDLALEIGNSVLAVIKGNDEEELKLSHFIGSDANTAIKRIQCLGYIIQACLRPRDRFWDIPVPKIDSAFDNLLVPQTSWSPSTTQQLRKLVAAPYLTPNDCTPRLDAYFASPLALCARRVSSAASRLLGSTSLRFALHGWQRGSSLTCPAGSVLTVAMSCSSRLKRDVSMSLKFMQTTWKAARGRWASSRQSISSLSSAGVCSFQYGTTSFQYPVRISSLESSRRRQVDALKGAHTNNLLDSSTDSFLATMLITSAHTSSPIAERKPRRHHSALL